MAQADYDQAYSDYQTALGSARSAQASLDRAKINLKYATIIAPVSGVVVSRAVDVGQTVAASFSTPTLFSIANDLTKMQVQANVDEADIGKIQNGQEVTFSVDAYEDRIFNGKVSQIRLQPTVSQNVVNYTVIINVPNPDMKLLPGMTANITVHVQASKDILKVPSSALRFNPSQEIIAKMMKLWPDSIQQKMGKWMAHKGQGGQVGQVGQVGQGGQGRQGGQVGQSGQADRRAGGQYGQAGQQGMKEKRTSGFIWVKQGEVLIPQRVRLGLSDGSYTEVSGSINEGDEIVIGVVNQQGSSSATQTTSPFQMRPPSGRGGR
jgi:HlyD family secretion protein